MFGLKKIVQAMEQNINIYCPYFERHMIFMGYENSIK
jgi:hypothetical protein